MEGYNLEEVLEYIDPASLDYTEFIEIGMALKSEGYPFGVWDGFARRDTKRYKGTLEKKWNGFADGNAASPVKAGSIVEMARSYGWSPAYDTGYALSWDDCEVSDNRIVDAAWIEPSEIKEPAAWQPAQQVIDYIEALFEANEIVGYVTESWEKDGRWIPANKGDHTRTAGQLIEAVSKYGDDLDSSLGAYNPEAGAWIRFNPLDGGGVRNDNVTEFKYALVESDNTDLEKQKAIIEQLELPVAAMVHSGSKSIHAIVRVDAKDYNEYRKRVDYLYSVCRKNGLDIDTQNKNPSRLSRLPGCTRGGRKQFLIATNVGKESWDVWHEWMEELNDDLPEPENLADFWDNLPELSPPLIDGILRQGHKMLLAGPSKAGKSFSLIELCIAIAEGSSWLGLNCEQGKVLYVNLELDRASCLHRFKDVYTALGLPPKNISSIDIWNLRGRSRPMDKLTPSLIRRAQKNKPIAVIIDPIYKVITGDENSADQMAAFFNQFDKVANELNSAVIYCHHHSKGSQGQKRSMDRASGSGVFARDPDAQLDLIELELTDAVKKQNESDGVCRACEAFMAEHGPDGWEDVISQDARTMGEHFLDGCRALLAAEPKKQAALLDAVFAARKKAKDKTAWRVEGNLREFPSFPPINLWFDHPRHYVDSSGILDDLESDSYDVVRKPGKNGQQKTREERAGERKQALENAFDACDMGEGVTLKDVAEFLGITEKTARNHAEEHGGFWIKNGTIGRRNNENK